MEDNKEVQYKGDLRAEERGGKHRRKWRKGKRTSATIRYCGTCDRYGRKEYACNKLQPGLGGQGLEYSLNKKKRWELLRPPGSISSSSSSFSVELLPHCRPPPVDQQWLEETAAKKKRRDKVRLKGYANWEYPNWRKGPDKSRPPRTHKLRPKMPTFLLKPELESYEISAAELSEYLPLDLFPVPRRYENSTRTWEDLNPIGLDDVVTVFLLDNEHRMPEKERHAGMVLAGNWFKSERYWHYCHYGPQFKEKAPQWCLFLTRGTAPPSSPSRRDNNNTTTPQHAQERRRGRWGCCYHVERREKRMEGSGQTEKQLFRKLSPTKYFLLQKEPVV